MVDITKDNRDKHDTYLLFKRKEDITDYLAHKQVPSNRFKAKDCVDYSTGHVEHNSVSHNDTHSLSISTSAHLDFCNNDYLYDVRNRIIWRIDSIGVDDNNQMKEYSSRPSKDTILNLVR